MRVGSVRTPLVPTSVAAQMDTGWMGTSIAASVSILTASVGLSCDSQVVVLSHYIVICVL